MARKRRRRAFNALAVTVGILVAGPQTPAFGASNDLEIALNLANMLRAARAVISSNQALINDPSIGDKQLTGKAVVEKAVAGYEQVSHKSPESIDPNSREGRLLAAQLAAIAEVMDENQDTINVKGVGFKGFVPAVFARMVNERFEEKVGDEAQIKVTAPPDLIRNRKARPDSWETELIEGKLMSPNWPAGQLVWAEVESGGRDAFRVLVPEYYTQGCLSCHGEPKGEIDITGYPKEGGKLNDLGGVISVVLYR